MRESSYSFPFFDAGLLGSLYFFISTSSIMTNHFQLEPVSIQYPSRLATETNNSHYKSIQVHPI